MTHAHPPLSAAAIREHLPAEIAALCRIDVVDETASTNADLLAAAADLPDLTFRLAEYQSAGRGRNARPWVAPKGSMLAMSVLVTPETVKTSELSTLPLVVGIAVVTALRATTGLELSLKWPNDLQYKGKKLGGILTEVASLDPVPQLVSGWGTNITLSADQLPIAAATSLLLENSPVLDRNELAAAMIAEFCVQQAAWRAAGGLSEEQQRLYRQACATIGQDVKALLPGGATLRGIAEDIDAQGRLCIRLADTGELHPLTAGDVTHVRPGDFDYSTLQDGPAPQG